MPEVKLKENTIHTINALPKLGLPAPDFKLTDGDLVERSLKDYSGKRKLISFVPSLDTAVCSVSTKKFNEALEGRSDVIVLVVSADLPFAQNRWCGVEKARLVIPLSMMQSKECAKSYGVLMENGPLAGLCARAVFVLDQNDRISYFELVSDITQEPNYDKALAALFQ